jgi:hypothetical protein
MKRNMGTTVALGLAFGAGIGAALHNIAIGVAVGLLFGAALGLFADRALFVKVDRRPSLASPRMWRYRLGVRT